MPRNGVLQPHNSKPNCNDFKLKGDSCWITVNNLSVWLYKAEMGGSLLIQVYPEGHEAESEPITGCSALFSDAKAS